MLTTGLLALGFSKRHYSMPAPGGAAPRRARVGEDGRGRFARTPSEIPARGWKGVLLRVYANISQHRLLLVAAGVTFYALLAIFPAVAALVAIYGLFADPAKIAEHLNSMSGVFPGGAIEVLRDQMDRLAAQGGGTLGLAFVLGLAASLWSANSGTKSIFDALNLVYREDEKRGFVRLTLVALAMTLAAIAFVLIALLVMVVLPPMLNAIGLGGTASLLVKVLRWPILVLIVAILLAPLYRYGPSRARAQWRWITWGSAFAALAWVVLSLLFSWYAENFGGYNKTYGTLGAAIGFMVWMWLSTVVILIGAEFDAEMEHQTVRDTTEGEGKALGARGARMADTVGAERDDLPQRLFGINARCDAETNRELLS
jgi:membrane protein